MTINNVSLKTSSISSAIADGINSCEGNVPKRHPHPLAMCEVSRHTESIVLILNKLLLKT